MKADVDLDARVTIARSDLARLLDCLPSVWAHRYDPDLGRPEWVPPSDEKRYVNHCLWITPTQVQRAYIESLQEVARANRCLLRDTDVEKAGHPWWTAQLLGGDTYDGEHVTVVAAVYEPKDENEQIVKNLREAPTLALPDAFRFVRDVSAALEWCRDADLRPPERARVLEACDHARAALERVPDALRKGRLPEREVWLVRSCVRCGGDMGERRGAVCQACVQADYRARRAS